jgi:GntR family transcriptional regulator
MLRFFRFQSEDSPSSAPVSRILQRRFRHPTRIEADAFRMAPDGQVMQLERLRSIDQTPCLLETIVLPLPLFGALADSDTDGIVVQQAQDNLRFSQLNAAQARRLRLDPGHPCVLVERQALDVAGRCIERRTTRGDAYSFTYTAHVK